MLLLGSISNEAVNSLVKKFPFQNQRIPLIKISLGFGYNVELFYGS